jgi:hypothetical protein
LKTSGSATTWTAGAALPVLPRLILATAAVPESSSLAQVIRGIHGACSCNGAPSLAPSCSSRCSTFRRRSPCSHTRDGRNRADRFVCQAYDGLQEFIQRAACRSCRFIGGALGCRRLAHKKFHPICSPSHLRVVRRGVGTFDRIGDCVDRAISGPLCDYGSGVAYGVTASIVTRAFEVFRADATAPTVGSVLRNDRTLSKRYDSIGTDWAQGVRMRE